MSYRAKYIPPNYIPKRIVETPEVTEETPEVTPEETEE
jgi:hypothetical protein